MVILEAWSDWSTGMARLGRRSSWTALIFLTCVHHSHQEIPFKLRRAPPHLFTILTVHLTAILWAPFIPYLPQSPSGFQS